MENKNNPELIVGDEVILLHMKDEYMRMGLKGLVRAINNTPWGTQYSVEWENGNRLDLIPGVDKWMKTNQVKKKEVDESNDPRINSIKKNLDVLKYLKKDKDKVFNFLSKLQDSGLINMLGAGPVLGYSSEDMKKWIEGMFNDSEDYTELIDAADESRDALIRAVMNMYEDKGLDIDDMDKVNRDFRNLTKKIMELYVTNYKDFIKKR